MKTVDEIKNQGNCANRPLYAQSAINIDGPQLVMFMLTVITMLVAIDRDVEVINYLMSAIEIRDIVLVFLLLRTGLIVVHWPERRVVVLGKATKVLQAFVENCSVKFVGVCDFRINDYGGVLHPVDFFVKHFYDRYYPREADKAFGERKRTNPVLKLRLAQLNKFGIAKNVTVSASEVSLVTDEIYREFVSTKGFGVMAEGIVRSVNEMDLDGLKVDMTSAAGYPYNQGVKRGDVIFDAIEQARRMLNDDEAFTSYMFDHKWYTTGRAKMQLREKDDGARLVIYSGFAAMLIPMLYYQVFHGFMNTMVLWCGVGMSWMSNGAEKFAKYFDAIGGFAPKGYRYVSVDIKDWDTGLNPMFFKGVMELHMRIMRDAGVRDTYVWRFRKVFLDMVNAKVLFPLGYLFHLHQGMKSGWCSTANDNTLIHEVIFRIVERDLGVKIKHLLYGDDNFMLVPDCVTDGMIIESYLKCGLVVGRIHSSAYMGDIDFLSKYVKYRDGEYFVHRPAIETHSRILMPEEGNPGKRDRPDAVIAAERALGHLLDNPFDKNVRCVCYDLLTSLRDRYGIDYIDVHDGMLRMHPWRHFDITKIPKRFPIVPSIDFIEGLYGVRVNPISWSWPGKPEILKMSFEEAGDSLKHYAVSDYSITVALRVSALGRRAYRGIIRKLSPYAQPTLCYGFHAARLEWYINHMGLSFDNALDLGSHPGACAASLLKYCDSVTCVSIHPSRDEGKVFCPYVFNDPNVKKVVADANTYVPEKVFDLVHDDVDVVGSRSFTKDVEMGIDAIDRAIRMYKYSKRFLFSIREVMPRTIERLYDLYVKYGHIEIVKPLYSNPWKCEFMVCAERRGGHRIRKVTFIRRLNSLLNSSAVMQMRWIDVMIGAISGYEGASKLPLCPWQSDSADDEGKWIKRF